MEKFSERRDLYDSNLANKERTRERLDKIQAMGMDEILIAEFGIKGITSGLYIEKVWNYTDNEFSDYLEDVEKLKVEAQKISRPKFLVAEISKYRQPNISDTPLGERFSRVINENYNAGYLLTKWELTSAPTDNRLSGEQFITDTIIAVFELM